jgi:hypothetical protein
VIETSEDKELEGRIRFPHSLFFTGAEHHLTPNRNRFLLPTIVQNSGPRSGGGGWHWKMVPIPLAMRGKGGHLSSGLPIRSTTTYDDV